jgi:tripartite-type tricarboxylate transporter receptor subunit TctC
MLHDLGSPTLRRTALRRLAAGSLLATLSPAALWAQPGRVVKLVVPTAPGGSVDSAGRLLADTLSRNGDARYIVDNRAGAGGVIGLQSVAKSPADGLTLVVGIAATLSVQPAVNPTLPYDPVRDLSPIAVFAQGGLVIAVPANSPCHSIKDLKALSAQAGELTFGTGGQGTFGHLSGELLKTELGIPLRHIPYRGSAPALTDLAGGQLHMAVIDAFSASSQVQAGKIRILAIAGPNRHPTFPDVPTLTESGVPFQRGTWVGLFGPAGLPAPIVDRLAGELKAQVEQPEFRKQLHTLGFVPLFMGTAEVTLMLKKEIEEWKRTAKNANVSMQ